MAKYPKKVFRGNQIAISLNQTEAYTILCAIRNGWILEGKTTQALLAKIHDALVSSGRDPKKFGYGGEECRIGICREVEANRG